MPAFNGTAEPDVLIGDGSPDTFNGAAGGDTVSGDVGFDLFVIGGDHSPAAQALTNAAALDVITDWSGRDRLLFLGANPAIFGSVGQGTADTYEDAYNQAVAAFGGQGREYYAVNVGADVYVFAIRTGQAVKLLNASLADVQRFNFVTGTLDGGIVETGAEGGVSRILTPGADQFTGGTGSDTVNAGDGTDTIGGGAGDDQVFGGLGVDSITGGDGSNYLRGDDGDDIVQGGAGFDDINGNMGRDSLAGGSGNDWVVGGKDDDIVFGEGGNDLVYGNLGNDTVGGGAGQDTVRGGQGDDLVRGDDGNDILSGDLGNDTLDGGLGADIFLTFATTGSDKVIGFNAGEGDRVQLDPGTTYTLSQDGADVIINLGFGNRMVIEGVQLSLLPDGWIYVLG